MTEFKCEIHSNPVTGEKICCCQNLLAKLHAVKIIKLFKKMYAMRDEYYERLMQLEKLREKCIYLGEEIDEFEEDLRTSGGYTEQQIQDNEEYTKMAERIEKLECAGNEKRRKIKNLKISLNIVQKQLEKQFKIAMNVDVDVPW
jgi:hypothetical protein